MKYNSSRRIESDEEFIFMTKLILLSAAAAAALIAIVYHSQTSLNGGLVRADDDMLSFALTP